MSQLTIEGAEVPAVTRGATRAQLRGRELAVVDLLRREHVISSSQAGRAAHEFRNKRRAERGWHNPSCDGYRAAFEAEGCCKWAPSDGMDVLRRLASRGIVEQIGGPGGLWAVVADGETPGLPVFDPAAWRRKRR